MTSIIDSVGNQTTYTYDALDRQITDTNQLGKTRTLSYDAVGNRIKTIDRNGRSISYSYDNLDRETSENCLNGSNEIVKTFAYTYDAVGHLLTSIDPDSKYTYTYDAVDRFTSVDNTGTAGVPAVKFNYGYDVVGNLLTVNDSINGINAGITAYTYDGYTGREQDGESGLDYYRARYYDASNGRFISEDPIGFNAGDTNLTRYVGNSPVNATDPSGLEELDIPGLLWRSFWGLVEGATSRPVPPLVPPLARPVNRPLPSPSPSPKPTVTPPPNPNSCKLEDKNKTCANHEEYYKYSHISEASKPSVDFDGFTKTDLPSAINSMKTYRSKYLKFKVPGSNPARYMADPTSQFNLVPQNKADAIDYLRFLDPGREAKHYNIYIQPSEQFGNTTSGGSIGSYKFCDDTGGKIPQLVTRYGILNIKEVNGQKYGFRGGKLIRYDR